LVIQTTDNEKAVSENISLTYEGEKHFKNIRQLTFGGDNAEAYWSFDDSKLIFQSNFADWGVGCDQIFITDWQNDQLGNSQPKMISTGNGRTTCSYLLPGDSTFVYGSTHLVDEECPPVPGRTIRRHPARVSAASATDSVSPLSRTRRAPHRHIRQSSSSDPPPIRTDIAVQVRPFVRTSQDNNEYRL